jgi:iron(III) transport system substrate-binding protein
VRRAIATGVLVVLGLVAVLGLSGCGDDEEALTIYTGRTESLVGPLLERFSEETGIATDVRYGDTNDLALLIGTEGDRSPADVYWGQSPGATAYLAGRDLLAPLPAETLAEVAAGFEDPDGEWVGVSGRERTLVYNQDRVEQGELPDSVLDLTGPAYRGRVALAPSNGSFQDFVTAMRAIEGEQAAEDWLRAMAANDVRTYANNNAIVEAVGRG